MRRRGKYRFGAVLVTVLLCSCSGRTASEPFVQSVSLTKPVALSGETTRFYSGVVKAAHEVNLGFKTAGQIARICVSEGDYVQQGQLLAELDDADYRLAVEALQIQYDQLKDEVERMKQLFDRKSVSANDFEKASAGLRQLGVQLQVSRNKLDYTKLYAPTDGYIQQVNYSPAEMVDAGTPLFNLLDVSHMEVVADIPAGEYSRHDLFTRFYCKVAGIEDEFTMKLSNCSPKADGNQLYQLCLIFTGKPDRRLTAGMNAEVGIVAADGERGAGFAVPLCAVFRDNDGDEPCVWVFGADSTVSKRPVVLRGTDAEGRAVIVEGLTGNEQVVRAGVHVLQDGEQVRVIERAAKTNIGGLL